MNGILFKDWKHRAIRESPLDRLWQTRRLPGLKEINKSPNDYFFDGGNRFYHEDGEALEVKPRFQVGEVVYIKEAWWEDSGDIYYKMGWQGGMPTNMHFEKGKWKSPLFMPAWAARDFILITRVRPERLQEITVEDIIAEGVLPTSKYGWFPDVARLKFQLKWDAINPKYPWASNPWVFVNIFKKVEKE